ncbi:MAG: VanW family protein [Actinobacteria bacterium]|nr:VanW family protein [Actinomycetota bacterium]
MQTVAPPEASEQTSKLRPSLTPIALALGGLVLVLVVGLLVLRSARPEVLPNVTLASIDVAGMTEPELRSAVASLAGERVGELITVSTGERHRTATNATVGYAIDEDATVAAVWRRGRQANPLRALSDHVQATVGSIAVAPVDEIDVAAVDAWAATTATALAVPPTEGSIRFAGTTVRRRDPEPGQRPAPDQLADGAREAFTRPGPDTLRPTTEPIRPRTTTDDVDRLVRIGRTLVSGPIELTRRDETLTLEPEQIAGLYRVELAPPGQEPPLTLTLVRSRLREVLTDDVRSRFEVEPRDATVELTAGGPQVRDARRGFRVSTDKLVEQVDMLARTDDDGGRSARMAGDAVRPDRTTKEARQLRITQKVSSFTTEHACCQGRVTNIHRFADIMDGELIEPGDTLSLNGHVGPRTAAKGFVGGGAIQRGEYVEEVGGGVSQFATTFFNAAFFGGYEILDHKPHSYYISRYPAGRESTINYPTVDVVIRNNSPYGLLVDTSYTDTSITVTFWGRKWADVDSTTGTPHNYTNPQVEIRTNPDLAPGTERVLQSGKQGFDIVVTRRLRYEDGETRNEEYFTRYLAEPRIIERGPDTPEDAD